MRYVVTGGAGFIGSHLVEELVKRGQDVVVIDNLSNGRLERLKKFMDKIRFVKGDILDIELLKKEFLNADYVLHYAALISVTESVQHPDQCMRINVDGTRNVLEAAMLCKVKRVVFASSCAVYGDTKIVPTKEDSKLNPLSPYAASKVEGEKLLKQYYEEHGLETIAFRYTNVFGPRQDPSSPYAGVISIFIKKILNNEQPIIYGDGEQTRDFVFVKNIVEANMLACKAKKVKNEKGIDIFGNIFNISTQKEVSVNKLFSTINKLTHKKIKPIMAPAREGEIRRSCADCSKAKKFLGYKSKHSFEHGLKKTISWVKQQENSKKN